MRRPYYLIKRGEIWYYRLNRTSGLVPSDKTWHSTSCKSRRKAEEYMADLLASGSEATTPAKHQTFRRYAKPFFVWGEWFHAGKGALARARCPPVARRRLHRASSSPLRPP